MIIVYELLAKISSYILRAFFNTGGETWPGELVLRLNRSVGRELSGLFDEVIFIVGTNGKTSTAKLLKDLLVKTGHSVLSNVSGANMLNGVVSGVLLHKKLLKNSGYIGVFEIDEYAFPELVETLPPSKIIILNVLRDQLDRYGEVDSVLSRWRKSLKKHSDALLFVNAHDPGLFELCKHLHGSTITYFGIPDPLLRYEKNILGDHAFCPQCSHKFVYDGIYVAHLGKWKCNNCGYSPSNYFVFSTEVLSQLEHVPDYVVINAESVYLILKTLKIEPEMVVPELRGWKGAFGRGELYEKENIKYHFYLGKNPASWTVSLNVLSHKLNEDSLLILGLNNRIPDGHDVSWIYDVQLEKFKILNLKFTIVIVGDRRYDMAVRLKIENVHSDAVIALDKLNNEIMKHSHKDIFILANYSSLLDLRKYITGRAIL